MVEHRRLCKATLNAGAAAFILLSATGAAAEPIDRWASAIASASTRFGVPEPWIRQVMRLESGGHTRFQGQPIVSRAGAMGLMQLMPGTWRDMRDLFGLGSDPHDPTDNILAGTAYLRLLYDRFAYPGLFAAYNAGPKRYGAYLAGARPLPAETRAYVDAVGEVKTPPASMLPPPAASLFAVEESATPMAPKTPTRARPTTLFVVLNGLPRAGCPSGEGRYARPDARQEQDDGSGRKAAYRRAGRPEAR
jgi:soluble lytic murein transglycosylase-like protein